MKANDLLAQLSVGDRRTTGASAEVTARVLDNPELFDPIFNAIWQNDDPGTRMRAANVCETVTRARPDLLQARKSDLLKNIAPIPQQEVRWHYCQMLARVKLTRAERRRAFDQLKTFLDDKSSIVKTFAMQALFDLAEQDPSLQSETRALLERLAETGTPAMKSRGKKLLRALK